MPRIVAVLAVVLWSTWFWLPAGAQESAAVAPSQSQGADPPRTEPSQTFSEWREAFLAEARERGFSDALLADALGDDEPLEHVIASDRTQAELTPGLNRYLRTRVTRPVIARGRELARRHRPLLRRITAAYGVQSRYLLAIWAIESRYGRLTGRIPIFRALSTLAWEPRRASFFRGQLFDALTVVARGYIDAGSMKGSWAGAMGQPQFMPSSYLEHAVDFDGDGRRDIWSSPADALASIASYLKAYGWHAGVGWGREVTVPAKARGAIARDVPMRTTGCYAMRNMTERMPLSRWKALGVTRVDGKPLPRSDIPAGLVQTDTRQFLVYANYDAILGYNCAHYYALSVALLADRFP